VPIQVATACFRHNGLTRARSDAFIAPSLTLLGQHVPEISGAADSQAFGLFLEAENLVFFFRRNGGPGVRSRSTPTAWRSWPLYSCPSPLVVLLDERLPCDIERVSTDASRAAATRRNHRNAYCTL